MYICTINLIVVLIQKLIMNNFLIFLNISGGEILVILVVVYLVFGPKKIPELARMLGKGINQLRQATNEIKNEITKETSGLKKDLGVDIDLTDPLDLNKPTKPKKTAQSTVKPEPKQEKKRNPNPQIIQMRSQSKDN